MAKRLLRVDVGRGSQPAAKIKLRYPFFMDVVALTRQLVDIESITGHESAVGETLHRELAALKYQVRRMPVEGDRFNVLATSPEEPRPAVVFSTHMDTVPPFIPSSEDRTRVYGRGSCDAKGIIAIQIAAAERLRTQGIHVGLLFVVGEERDSTGAKKANEQPIGSRFLINGEPTENRLALASKGTLRAEVTASGRMAHSAYPELGESAIDKLVVALTKLRAMTLPTVEDVGPCTFNIGLIEGGRAPNVIPDLAKAHLLYRLIGPTEDLRRRIQETVGDLVKVDVLLAVSAPGVAPKGLGSTGDARYNRLWTLTGTPCVNIPAHVTDGGLPVGVQVIARYGDDAKALAAARFVEEALARK
jgi:acetylornithine deacetylase